MKERGRKHKIVVGTSEFESFQSAVSRLQKDEKVFGKVSYNVVRECKYIKSVEITCQSHALFLIGQYTEYGNPLTGFIGRFK